jgi:glycosyltransferase involved in cell wall biosynthesis
MTAQEHSKIRLLWIDEMEFDSSAHKSRLIEMISNLQRDCDVRLLTTHRRNKVQPEVFKNKIVYHRRLAIPYLKRFVRYLAQCSAYRSVVRAHRPNVVLFNCSNIALLRYAAARRKQDNTRLIYDVRTLPVDSSSWKNWTSSRMQASCLRFAARHFDGITYITDQMKGYCTDAYKLPPHRSTVWTSGVNAKLFSPSPTRNGLGSLTILYHGHIHGQRRIDNVIKAMPLLKDIDIHFALLGNSDGFEELKKIAEELGVEDRVSFNRSVKYEEVPDWIRRCDVGILPFHNWDGWNVSSPLKLFEYLACGKPVIVTDIPAHRRVLEGSDFAFWAKRSSPEHIAMAIRQAHDRLKDFKRLSSGARRLVLEKYTWEKQAEKLKQLCDSVLKID